MIKISLFNYEFISDAGITSGFYIFRPIKPLFALLKNNYIFSVKSVGVRNIYTSSYLMGFCDKNGEEFNCYSDYVIFISDDYEKLKKTAMLL